MAKTAFLFTGQGARGSEHTQLDIFAVSLASYESVAQPGRKPDMVAGLSLGEFAAMVAARVLDYQAAETLVLKRLVLMNRACQESEGWMVAIIGPLEPLERIIAEKDDVVIAGYNSPRQHVISGKIRAVQSVMEALKAENGFHAQMLNVPGAFHSPLMAGANSAFQKFVEATDFKAPEIPFYSSVTGDRLKEPGRHQSGNQMPDDLSRPLGACRPGDAPRRGHDLCGDGTNWRSHEAG